MGLITTPQCDVFQTMGAKSDVRRVRVTVHVADDNDEFPETPRQSYVAYLSKRARMRSANLITKAFSPPSPKKASESDGADGALPQFNATREAISK